MRILLTNDDGLEAEGLQVLKRVLNRRHQVIVVAPDGQRSASGHGITLKNPLQLNKVREHEYSCSGLPADCTLMGLFHVLKEDAPDLVISGINHGANLGIDTFYSGTVAGAREACIRGIPAISLSLCCDFYGSTIDNHFESAAELLLEMLEQGMLKHFISYEFININFPNLPRRELKGVELAGLGMRQFTSSFKQVADDRYTYDSMATQYLKIGGSDCLSIVSGKISFTPLNIFAGLSDRKVWQDFVTQLTTN